MHELSIAMNILKIAEEESQRHGGAIVHAIHLKLGPFSGVEEAALVSAYELARELSPFPDSKLVIELVPLLANCDSCQSTQPVESIQKVICSQCGMPVTEIIQGREMEINAMEIEDAPTSPPQSFQT